MKKIIILILIAAMGGIYWFILRDKMMVSEDPNHLVLYGNVDIRDVVLGFRVPGRIDSLSFEEGDRVKKGEVMATLDQVPYQQELNQQKAEQGEIEVRLKNAEKNYKRRAALVKTGAVSKTSFDDATAARDEAKAQIVTALTRTALAETNLTDTVIRSPSDGTILTRILEPGSIVSSGSGVYTLALIDPVWIRCYVDEPNLGNIFPGQHAEVFTDGGKSFHGQVGFISPQAEFTPKTVETTQLRTDLVYRLRVIVANPVQGLRQGMPVTVKLAKRNHGE